MNINHLRPCTEAAQWLETQPDIATAWNCCQRGDWMMWLLTKLPTPKEVSVTLACGLARSVLHLVPASEDRPRLAIEAAERWLAEPTEENRIACWAACWAAARAAARAADAAARAAAWDAARAAHAARAAADAAADAAQADIIREVVSAEWVEGALKS